ncbi:unnamed protein product [Bursaphelenchus okinawaensis]|uniref:Biogenesis of lysosome-related organelles complex 1 subunit 5 n=1 Tax=Bursaphelenchus okinawaensis TaxID=465554 RepID=A0A811JTT8_9BILA|nr:unnamed protein product [Bursaphelenchus okinawaensis]CAG9082181.1 unnamed protein product [Bursaphelenchus okinawaensis]
MNNTSAERISLNISNVLNHKQHIGADVEKFRDGFERNERFKELNGLVRRNQRIVEALDDFERLDMSFMNDLTDQLGKLKKTLHSIDRVKFSESELQQFHLTDVCQMTIKKLADEKFSQKSQMNVILE